jgi:hypothetical protein
MNTYRSVARFFVKHTKMGKIYQTNPKYTKLPQHTPKRRKVGRPKGHKKIPVLSISRPSKIYPKFGFWFKNKPSGNPGLP